MADLIACLPGDGIGPEVLDQGVRVLESLPVDVEIVRLPFGGAAIDELGEPLPAETLATCRASRAVLLGAVGGPQLGRRRRAARAGPDRHAQGARRLREPAAGPPGRRSTCWSCESSSAACTTARRACATTARSSTRCEYHPSQVERIARRAFALASGRRGSLVSVDKANILDTSRMWRRVVGEVAQDFPEIELRHALVDSFAMEIVTSPERIDVVVTENTFGDILSDVAAAVTGGLGLAASASLGDGGPGIFEPVHGSAPDIAGTGAANPAAMLRSVALLLDHALGRPDLAAALDAAVDADARRAADAGRGRRCDDRRLRRRGARGARTDAFERSGGDAMSVTVGYPGPAGSHSDAAASVLVPDAADSIGLPSFSAVVSAATAAEVSLGVLPIESSLVGPIAETHDLLYGSALSIVREATLPIRHCVLGVAGATHRGRGDALVASGGVRPVPRAARVVGRAVRARRDDRRRGSHRLRGGRSDAARDRERRGGEPRTGSR